MGSLVSCWSLLAQNGPVQVTGAMRNTLFNGQLAGLIELDSLARPGTYGIGRIEYLRGEVLVLDGEVYTSVVKNGGSMLVTRGEAVKAPFFVHQTVEEWTEVQLPDSVVDLAGLDRLLTARDAGLGKPFAFRLSGPFERVEAHIVDVPLGTVINGPDDAHRDNKHFHMTGTQAEALGFFSTAHKAVFTHHDTNIHVHAITADRDWMGHVEALSFVAKRMVLQVALP
ncbi:MAG: acetolactate decarboxylase [Flavobacteriales bacterium]